MNKSIKGLGLQFAKPSVKLTDKDLAEIKAIVASGWFCEGKYVEEFEDYFKKTYNVKYAISCSSATQGLIITLKAANISHTTVALPAFTWPSTLYAIECNGCEPFWIDIDINTWNITDAPEFVTFESKTLRPQRIIGKEITAILPVDIFGNRAYIKDDRPVIYDAAHSFGVSGLGKRGIAEVVSFSFTKPVTSMQGGVILTDDDDIYYAAWEFRRLTAKMCEINALIGLKEIARHEEKLFERKRLIDLYRYYIDVPYTEQVIEIDSNYSTYSLLFEKEKRDRIADAFRKNNIEVKIYYDPLVSGLQNTDYIYNHIISLPLHAEVEDVIVDICKIINEA